MKFTCVNVSKMFWLSLIFLGICVSCTTQFQTPSETIAPQISPTNPPIEQVSGCSDGGEGVFTSEDVRCYLATFDPQFVYEINEDVVVLFTDPNSIAEWIGGAIIYHIPSVSTLVLDRFGDVDPANSNFTSRPGLTALAELSKDAIRMAELKQKVQAIWQTTSPGEPEIRLGVAWQDGTTTVFLISMAGLETADDRFYCASQSWTIGEENIHVEATCAEKADEVFDNHVLFSVQEVRGREEQQVQLVLNEIPSNLVTIHEVPISLEAAVYEALFRQYRHNFAFLRGETAWPGEDISFLVNELSPVPSPELLENFVRVNEPSLSLLYLFWDSESILYQPGWVLDRDYLANEGGGIDCERFKADYPDFDGIFTLSQIGLSANEMDALVFVRQECGTKSILETYVLLELRNDEWAVVDEWTK